jgi:uncharacterized protein YdeI (YjbR/CyaY-like superfamily)
MTSRHANPEVDQFFASAKVWKEEYERLRTIVLACHLEEGLKWGKPCYAFESRNIVLIHGFKDYCALLFFKGALLNDLTGVLVRQTDNVQAARQIRFTNAEHIAGMEGVLKAIIEEAIDVERAGKTVDFKKTTEFVVPEEFEAQLAGSPDLKAAFAALTPGRQRGYLLYFSAPKQSKTREARIEKTKPQILDGKGLDD